ncbi:MAG: DNA modification methylase, partial [Rhodospirillales bacterium 12-71-4]
MMLPWMAAKIVLRPVAELRPHAGNARVHSAEQLEQIKASMLAFGFTNPLLVDEDGVLIAGHGRLEAASALGIAKVPVIVLRHLSAAQKEALRLADNRIAENATWDQALLRDALAAVQAAPDIDLGALGFSADELADILAAAEDAVSDGDAPEALSADPAEGGAAAGAADAEETAEDPADADPEPPRQAVTRAGDLWLLGEHRLLCGDSTDAATVARVMGEDRAALLFTSPPYGNQRDYTTGGGTDWDALMQGVFQHLDAAMRPDGQVLVNLGLIHKDSEWVPYWA